jgi:hypothetical protein
MIVDSCLADPAAQTPRAMALEYLESMSINPATAVKLVVATHWHDDHVGGMSEIIFRCKKAKFAISNALTDREFQTLVEFVEPSQFAKSGVTEFWKIFGYLDEIGRPPTLSSAGKELWFRKAGMRVQVWALSPANRDVWLAIRRFRSYYQKAVGGTAEYVPALSPNDASVAVLVSVGETHILLGADLPRYKRALRGWKAVLDDVGVWTDKRAEVFKISHHGSSGSYEPRIWNEMLVKEPVAGLTPFVHGDVHLPTPAGVADIKKHTSQAFLTSSAAPSSGVPGPALQGLREATTNIQELPIAHGHVRLRKPAGASSWTVDLFGEAVAL